MLLMQKNMKYNFCTLFDKYYLTRGLALYNSLFSCVEEFKLWILCLDKDTFELLFKLNLKNVVLISLETIEDEKLLIAKSNRTWGEYCWTLGSVFTHYVLSNNPDLDHITYLDSDLYFYSSPQVIYDEMGDDSILIIKHNYVSSLKYLQKKGIYNVAMIIFKNDNIAKQCLTKWKDQCIDWCYNRNEDGKFGDQKYLDSWPQEYHGVHILNHKGGDVAPWNLGQYEITEKNNQVLIDNQILIFYHFHTFKIINGDKFQFYSSFYSFDKQIDRLIYFPYVKEIKNSIRMLKNVDLNFNYGYTKNEGILSLIKEKIKKFLVLIYFSKKKF